MSLSFGLRRNSDCGDGRDSFHQAVCRSVARGTVYVVAAGNEAHNARRNSPAAFDEVITVSALADYDGRGGGLARANSCPYWTGDRDDAFTSFSNYGPDVDIIAPGRCILSTYPRKKYAWMSGTSMASPHVAGAVAVYRAMYPRATPMQVRMALQAVGKRDWRTYTDPDREHEKAVWIGSFRTMPDFTTSAGAGSGRVAVGAKLSLSVAVKRVGGFTEPVSISLVDAPVGFSARTLSTTGTSAKLDLSVAPNVSPGRYQLVVGSVSGDIERTSVVSITVEGAPPRATFTTPAAGASFSTAGSMAVAWTETSGGSAIVKRTLERQSGSVRTAGTCADARFTAESAQVRKSPVSERTASGYCYRWRLTLTDNAGLRSTAESGTVLVDTTAPRAPSVGLPGVATSGLDLSRLGVDAAYLGHSGILWVRGGASGNVELEVNGYDAESGVATNNAAVDKSTGWSATWVGDPADGALRLSFTGNASDAELRVSTTNNAGLTGPPAVGQLAPDKHAPAPVTWVSAPTDEIIESTGATFALDWRGGSDEESGLADAHWVVRYRAPLNSRGACRTSSFALDGAARLLADGTRESDLHAGACYAWGVRTLDNVGNAARVVWSGFVVIEGR